MSSKPYDDVTIFSAYDEFRKRRETGGFSKPTIMVVGGNGSGRGTLKLGGWRGHRSWHKGHFLHGSRINNIVKVRYVKNSGDASRHLVDWLRYVQDRERSFEEPERKFFDRKRSDIERSEIKEALLEQRTEDVAFFKIMLSPKQNELDHEKYTREIMERWSEATGIKTDWYGIKHSNTLHHHVHLILPARDVDGNPYRLEREHLDLMREIANEHQYELQDRQYQYEKSIERELDVAAEQMDRFLAEREGKELLKELGVNSDRLERAVDELLPPTNFDDIRFRAELDIRAARSEERDPAEIMDLTRRAEEDKQEVPVLEVSQDDWKHALLQDIDRELTNLAQEIQFQTNDMEKGTGPDFYELGQSSLEWMEHQSLGDGANVYEDSYEAQSDASDESRKVQDRDEIGETNI